MTSKFFEDAWDHNLGKSTKLLDFVVIFFDQRKLIYENLHSPTQFDDLFVADDL